MTECAVIGKWGHVMQPNLKKNYGFRNSRELFSYNSMYQCFIPLIVRSSPHGKFIFTSWEVGKCHEIHIMKVRTNPSADKNFY